MAADGENIDEGQPAQAGAEQPSQDGASSGEADVISLDDIDSILAEEAPEFSQDMDNLASSSGDFEGGDLEETGVDVELPKEGLKERRNKFLKKLRSHPLIAFVLNLLFRIKLAFQRLVTNIKWLVSASLSTVLNFAKVAPRTSLEYSKYQLSKLSKWGKDLSGQYTKKTRNEKVLMVLFLVGSLMAIGLVYKTVETDWMVGNEPILIRSLEEVASRKWTYKMKVETTPFLAAFPQPKHSYLFRKIVVNLRQKVSSLAGAMGAFEFYVEVDSKDAASELKARETMFRDAIQRVAEQYNYETLQSEKGKTRLKEDIKSEINKELAQGWVKAVFIKFMVTKQ